MITKPKIKFILKKWTINSTSNENNEVMNGKHLKD